MGNRPKIDSKRYENMHAKKESKKQSTGGVLSRLGRVFAQSRWGLEGVGGMRAREPGNPGGIPSDPLNPIFKTDQTPQGLWGYGKWQWARARARAMAVWTRARARAMAVWTLTPTHAVARKRGGG